jgi:hypothetical protein
MHALLLVLT